MNQGSSNEDARSAFILASASPRRRQLLASRGLAFTVVPSDVPEIPRVGELPAQFVQRVAREKARAVASIHPDTWVLAADTAVVIDDDILGKPVDAADARAMLARLSGRAHHVLTGVALVGPDGAVRATLMGDSIVEFRALSPDEMDAYVASGESSDKAGAYAIQGGAAAFVMRVQGSYTNVIGLPLEEVCTLLRQHGLLADEH